MRDSLGCTIQSPDFGTRQKWILKDFSSKNSDLNLLKSLSSPLFNVPYRNQESSLSKMTSLRKTNSGSNKWSKISQYQTKSFAYFEISASFFSTLQLLRESLLILQRGHVHFNKKEWGREFLLSVYGSLTLSKKL